VGLNYYGATRTLDQVIVQLRKKPGDTAAEPRHLLTVHGVGYKLAGQGEQRPQQQPSRDARVGRERCWPEAAKEAKKKPISGWNAGEAPAKHAAAQKGEIDLNEE